MASSAPCGPGPRATATYTSLGDLSAVLSDNDYNSYCIDYSGSILVRPSTNYSQHDLAIPLDLASVDGDMIFDCTGIIPKENSTSVYNGIQLSLGKMDFITGSFIFVGCQTIYAIDLGIKSLGGSFTVANNPGLQRINMQTLDRIAGNITINITEPNGAISLHNLTNVGGNVVLVGSIDYGDYENLYKTLPTE
jgi:hypothetical protein